MIISIKPRKRRIIMNNYLKPKLLMLILFWAIRYHPVVRSSHCLSTIVMIVNNCR